MMFAIVTKSVAMVNKTPSTSRDFYGWLIDEGCLKIYRGWFLAEDITRGGFNTEDIVQYLISSASKSGTPIH